MVAFVVNHGRFTLKPLCCIHFDYCCDRGDVSKSLRVFLRVFLRVLP